MRLTRLKRLELTACTTDTFGELAYAELPALESMNLVRGYWDEKFWRTFARTPFAPHLRSLEMPDFFEPGQVPAFLAIAPALEKLETVHVNVGWFDRSTLRRLRRMPGGVRFIQG